MPRFLGGNSNTRLLTKLPLLQAGEVHLDYNECYRRTDTAGGVLSCYHPNYDDKTAYDFEAEVWTDPELEKKIAGSIQEGLTFRV